LTVKNLISGADAGLWEGRSDKMGLQKVAPQKGGGGTSSPRKVLNFKSSKI